jgi:hypothetical protein
MKNLYDIAEDVCRAKHGGNERSEAANAAVEPHKARLRDLVLRRISAAGGQGATLDEVCEALAKPPNALSGRIVELRARGRIVDSGRRRPTRSGSMAAVWIAVLPG